MTLQNLVEVGKTEYGRRLVVNEYGTILIHPNDGGRGQAFDWFLNAFDRAEDRAEGYTLDMLVNQTVGLVQDWRFLEACSQLHRRELGFFKSLVKRFVERDYQRCCKALYRASQKEGSEGIFATECIRKIPKDIPLPQYLLEVVSLENRKKNLETKSS